MHIMNPRMTIMDMAPCALRVVDECAIFLFVSAVRWVSRFLFMWQNYKKYFGHTSSTFKIGHASFKFNEFITLLVIVKRKYCGINRIYIIFALEFYKINI